MLGPLKPIKGLSACLLLAGRFYHRQKDIEAVNINVRRHGQVRIFQSQMAKTAKGRPRKHGDRYENQ